MLITAYNFKKSGCIKTEKKDVSRMLQKRTGNEAQKPGFRIRIRIGSALDPHFWSPWIRIRLLFEPWIWIRIWIRIRIRTWFGSKVLFYFFDVNTEALIFVNNEELDPELDPKIFQPWIRIRIRKFFKPWIRMRIRKKWMRIRNPGKNTQKTGQIKYRSPAPTSMSFIFRNNKYIEPERNNFFSIILRR